MKLNLKNIFVTFCILIIYILIIYFLTGIGFSKELMPVSGIPFHIGSVIGGVVLTILTYFELQDKDSDNKRK